MNGDDIVSELQDLQHIVAEIKGDAVLVMLSGRVFGDAAAKIERLRAAGDTLAHHVRAGESKEMYSAVHAWEEARRG